MPERRYRYGQFQYLSCLFKQAKIVKPKLSSAINQRELIIIVLWVNCYSVSQKKEKKGGRCSPINGHE